MWRREASCPPGTSSPSSNSVDFGAHGAEIFRNERDAVGFLDAQLTGAADADAAARVRRNGREHGKLVDELGGERATHLR